MGYIVERCESEKVKEAFKLLKDKVQRHKDAIPISPSNTVSFVRVPLWIREKLKETFSRMGWSEAEYFLQTLGKNVVLQLFQYFQEFHFTYIHTNKYGNISFKILLQVMAWRQEMEL